MAKNGNFVRVAVSCSPMNPGNLNGGASGSVVSAEHSNGILCSVYLLRVTRALLVYALDLGQVVNNVQHNN